MWHAVIAGVVFQHPSIASLRRELGRNPALLDRCGFEMLPMAKKPAVGAHVIPLAPYLGVPPDSAFSRFLATLVKLEAAGGYTKQMLASLRQSLTEVLPDVGRHLGFDGKAVESHSTGQKDRETGKASDPDADWGHHTTSGVDANGKAWTKVKSWFGYGLHVIADTHYELPVAVVVTCALASESPTLRQMIGELFAEQLVLAERCEDFSADRGLDAGETKVLLWDTYRLRPLIDTRELWRAEKQEPGFDPSSTIPRPLFPDRADTIVHTEMGNVRCCCPQTGEVRDLIFQGFEADRDTLKYRCPAAYVGVRAQAPRPATPQATSIPAPMGGSFASRSPSSIAASSCRRPMAAQAGIGATTGAAHWNESTTVSTTASASSTTLSAACTR